MSNRYSVPARNEVRPPRNEVSTRNCQCWSSPTCPPSTRFHTLSGRFSSAYCTVDVGGAAPLCQSRSFWAKPLHTSLRGSSFPYASHLPCTLSIIACEGGGRTSASFTSPEVSTPI